MRLVWDVPPDANARMCRWEKHVLAEIGLSVLCGGIRGWSTSVNVGGRAIWSGGRPCTSGGPDPAPAVRSCSSGSRSCSPTWSTANARLTHQPGDLLLVQADAVLATQSGFHLASATDPMVRVEHLEQHRFRGVVGDHRRIGLVGGGHGCVVGQGGTRRNSVCATDELAVLTRGVKAGSAGEPVCVRRRRTIR